MGTLDIERQVRQRKSKMLAGVLIIAFGILFLIDRTGGNIPNWIFSWKVIVIAIGIVTLYKHQFKHFMGYVLIAVGSVFLINDFWPNTIDSGLLLPIIVIAFGVIMIFKTMGFVKKKTKHDIGLTNADAEGHSPEDYLTISTFFGGVDKMITSKNFKGADITTLFGGTDLNFTKADIQHPVTVNATTLFGGLTLIVPSNWQVQSEMMTIFGGIDDKRGILDDASRDDSKILILKGNCAFGGVEIQSYI
ncbi:MAG: putative membrane protein [Flavobacteriaceae bacterium]|jgi:predicted membrane protein